MTTATETLPPFPDDVPLADIAIISFKKMIEHDPEEEARALKAVQTDGFFYLILTDSAEGQQLVTESNALLQLSKEAFARPLEEKIQYRADRGRSIFGYKPAGTVKATDKDKRPDTTEFFNISKDHLYGNGNIIKYLPRLEESKDVLKNFTKHCHDAGQFILRSLACSQGVPADSYTDKNPFDSLSGDHIRLTKKKPHETDSKLIGLPSHTDFGSVTVLFNWLGGLQIQRHNAEHKGEWNYVKPSPGHAIINLGDAMVKFSNGTLKSAKHRVVPSPGEQGNVDRYSLVYFIRPADHIIMEPIPKFRTENVIQVGGKVGEQGVYTAGEWNLRRIQQLAAA